MSQDAFGTLRIRIQNKTTQELINEVALYRSIKDKSHLDQIYSQLLGEELGSRDEEYSDWTANYYGKRANGS